MAVTVDATSTGSTTNAVVTQTLSNSNLTVGASATALVAFFNAADIVTGASATWGSQTMTSVVLDNTSSIGYLQIFGLVSPTSGNQTLTVNWTTNSPAILDCMSFKGSSTVFSSCFTNAADADPAASTSTTLTVSDTNTTPANDYQVASGAQATANWTGLSATGSTTLSNTTNNSAMICGYAPSAASLTWTFTDGSAVAPQLIGCVIAAPGAAPHKIPLLPLLGVGGLTKLLRALQDPTPIRRRGIPGRILH